MLSEDEKNRTYVAGKVLSARPLLTLISCFPDLRALDAFFDDAPEVFDTGRALHFLQLQWTTEDGRAPELASKIADYQRRFPGHIFMVLTGSETETFVLSQLGVPALLGNGSIFVDERVWTPDVGRVEGIAIYDAVYCARLDPFKRHELAAGIDRLMLTYGYAHSSSQATAYENVHRMLPNAYFANHELARGTSLNPQLVCRLNAHAHAGLCLSAVEGYMRASIEYLLCGLPVVSTFSVGGRDRYYSAPYCKVVEASADAVAAAVRALRDKGFDRRKIRHHVAQKILFDRYNFLLDANKIGKLHLGKEGLIRGFSPLVGSVVNFSPLPSVVTSMRYAFAGQSAKN